MSEEQTYDRPQGPDIGEVRRLLPISHDEYPLYVVCTEDAQEVAADVLDRELTDAELEEIRDQMHLAWRSEIETILLYELKLSRL